MSAVNAIGGSNQSILQYLQSLQAGQQNSPVGSKRKSHAAGAGDGASTPSVSSGPNSFFQQLQSSVTSALQSAQSGGANSNPNGVLQSAIAKVLKNQQNITAGSPDADGDIDGPGAIDTGGSAATSAFNQLLLSKGVNPQQFQQNVLSAIQSAQSGGAVNPGSVFSAFPAGSLVDVLA